MPSGNIAHLSHAIVFGLYKKKTFKTLNTCADIFEHASTLVERKITEMLSM